MGISYTGVSIHVIGKHNDMEIVSLTPKMKEESKKLTFEAVMTATNLRPCIGSLGEIIQIAKTVSNNYVQGEILIILEPVIPAATEMQNICISLIRGENVDIFHRDIDFQWNFSKTTSCILMRP
jgi:hypothetical protein